MVKSGSIAEIRMVFWLGFQRTLIFTGLVFSSVLNNDKLLSDYLQLCIHHFIADAKYINAFLFWERMIL